MTFRPFHLLIVILAALCLAVGNSWADVPTPRIKPAPPKLNSLLDKNDAKNFKSALSASDRRRWSSFKSHRNKVKDPVARDILFWLQATRDRNMSQQDLTYVVSNLHDWPRMTTIQARAESNLFDKPLPARETLSWFAGKEPVSGEGRIALANAYYAVGDTNSGDQWLKSAWRESKLTRDRQKKVFSRHKAKLTPEDHAARADYLIWEGTAHFSKVEGLMSLMPKADRALSDARMRVLRNRSGMDSAIKRVPSSHRNHPGLLYARGKWRRQKSSKERALEPFLQIVDPASSEKGKERLWRERKIMTYWAIDEGKFSEAYRLTRNHGMSRGTGFAEAEFLGGWLALTKLNKPALAEQHFQTLRNGVTTPVSISRGSYWLGRAHEAQNSPEAQTHYSDAARFSNTYYGFLAADRMSPNASMVILPEEPMLPLEYSDMASDRRIKAMELLAESGEERLLTQFSFHLDDVVEDLDDLSFLARFSKKYGYMRPSVRAAKQASRFQSMLTDSGYPMPRSIMDLSDKFDKAFVLSIARQESEFNNSAVSTARAYGMMQMINATAAATARKHRIPYSKSKLTSDIDYSAKLGALHLHDLLRQFDGSYVLAAVGYNAGPHRAKQWIREYGDPRKPGVDAVDWIENIPFSETRNYVQRVLENTQVYRARLNGNTGQNKILSDIKKGAF